MSGDRACPNCGAKVPLQTGLRAWCEQCNWGVGNEHTKTGDGFLARQYIRSGVRYGKALLETMKRTPPEDLRPRWTPSKAAGFFFAACVHMLSIVLVIGGIFLIATQYSHFLMLAFGVGLCIFAWLIRPKIQQLPKHDIVEREKFPALYACVNDIAQELGGKQINHIVVNEEFNASYQTAGWRRAPVLTIGLPLWMALHPQERLAVIGHEVAHGVNGDGTRNFLVFSALSALDDWVQFLRAPYYHAMTPAEVLSGCVTWALSYPFALMESLLVQLLYIDKQKAEYFADYLATKIVGTSAVVSTLQRLSCGEHLDDVLLKNAYSNTQSGAYIMKLFRERIAALPEREWRRFARASLLENARLDASHPPTAYRIEFLMAHEVAEPKRTATAAAMADIDSELKCLEESLGGRLISYHARD